MTDEKTLNSEDSTSLTDDVEELVDPVKVTIFEQNTLPDEYAALKNDFAQVVDRGMKSFQEEAQGRQINHIILRLQGRYGMIVETTERGLISMPEMSGVELDNQGREKIQRMYLGMNCSTNTKDTAFVSVNLLRPGQTSVKEFEVNAAAHEILRICVEKSQIKGEKIQQKVDEDDFKYFARTLKEGCQELSINLDAAEPISANRIFKLVTLARQTLKKALGKKLVECKVVFFSINDSQELADSLGGKCDTVITRTGFGIQTLTDKGNKLYGTIRGTGSLDALTRFSPDKTIEEVVTTLASEVGRNCIDMDRAQNCSVLGGEAYILMGPEVVGVLAHEVYGHTSEADIILENKHDKKVDLSLKARLGGQVSENAKFHIIDDGSLSVKVGNRIVDRCYGGITVDDDGNVGKRTYLVEKGIQQLALNSADTLEEIATGLPDDVYQKMIDHGVTGNLRSQRFDKLPIIRMTNTFVLPDEDGPNSLEELAGLVPTNKKGVYLKTCSGGWVDTSSGEFQVTGQLGYLIENGVITDKPVKDIIVRGNIAKFGSKIKTIGSSKTITQSFTGWCIAGDTPILTDKGLVSIQDINIGDRVLTHKGRFKKVLKTFKRTVSEPIYTLKSVGGLPVRLTGNHEALIRQARKGYKWWADNSRFTKVKDSTWTPTEEITSTTGNTTSWRPYAVMPKLTKEEAPHNSFLPMLSNTSLERMELYGWYLSEGNLHEQHGDIYGISFDGAATEAQADRIYSLIQDAFPEANPIKTYRETRDCWDVTLNSKDIARLFSEFGRYSHGKIIPAWVYTLPTEYRVALVRGYWKGDGSSRSTRRGMLCSSASPQLIGGLILLLGQLGVYPSYRIEKAEDVNKRDNGSFHANYDKHRLEIAGPQADKLATLLDMQNRTISDSPTQHHIELDEEFLTRIQSVEVNEEKDFTVYNLHVDEDNSYVTPGMALHNCGKNSQWVPVEGGGPAIIIEDANVGKEQPTYGDWGVLYKEYARQTEEVACGKRRSDEVYLKYIEDVTEEKVKDHTSICLVTAVLPAEEEVRLLLGQEPIHSKYTIGEGGELSEKNYE